MVWRVADWISIHATHTGRDTTVGGIVSKYSISIHATHTGRDEIPLTRILTRVKFQFTRPIRAAIYHETHRAACEDYFNSRDPYGPRSLWFYMFLSDDYFNSRDPYGPRLQARPDARLKLHFNSRDPYGPR